MDLTKTLAEFSDFLEGDEMTGRQAALVVAFWMGFTAFFGLIVYVVTFIIIGF